jgi:DHA2 family multidrug resistance protein
MRDGTPQSVVEYGSRRIIIVVGVMLASLLQTLDATIVNVALPTIEGNIGASIDDGTWIVTGYIISNVIAIPLGPFMLKRLGRRQYFALSIAGFTAASFLCGTATSLPVLVFYRIVQGAFGGGLIATSQVILRETLPPEMLAQSSAFFAIALTVGPAMGPTLGGILTDWFSWQWVFEINIVPGVIATVIVLTMLKNPAAPRRLAFDYVGVALLGAGLGSFQYVLDEGERNYWFADPVIAMFAVVAVVGIAAFVLWELFGTKTPIVDVRVFRYRNVAIGVPCAILLGMINFGPTVIFPQYTQEVLALTATLSGLLMLVRAVPPVLLTAFVARIATRVDPRVMIATGCAMTATSLFLLAARMTTGSDFAAFPLVLLLNGTGQAIVFVPLLVTVLGAVKAPSDAPKASSFIALAFQLGGSIASTMLVTIFDRRSYFHAEVLRSAATVSNPILRDGSRQGLVELAHLIALEASNAGFADSVLSLIPVGMTAAMLVFALARPARGR